MREQEKSTCEGCGYPSHAGHSPECKLGSVGTETSADVNSESTETPNLEIENLPAEDEKLSGIIEGVNSKAELSAAIEKYLGNFPSMRDTFRTSTTIAKKDLCLEASHIIYGLDEAGDNADERASSMDRVESLPENFGLKAKIKELYSEDPKSEAA
jgi:hypothetical protein